MKILILSGLLVGILLIGGGGFWFSNRDNAEPVVFHNDPIQLEPPSDDESSPIEANPRVEDDVPPHPLTSIEETPTLVSDTQAEPLSIESTPPVQATLAFKERLLGFGFRLPPEPRTIDTIVLHSSYNASGGDVYNLDKIIGQYEQYGVGAHYLIDRNGVIYRLVKEDAIAYHAGESKMPDGRKNVNDFSIGIEIMGTEESGFTGKQYEAVNDLIADIKTRYKIKDIVGHGDVAPKRKTDPWKFDWKKLK